MKILLLRLEGGRASSLGFWVRHTTQIFRLRAGGVRINLHRRKGWAVDDIGLRLRSCLLLLQRALRISPVDDDALRRTESPTPQISASAVMLMQCPDSAGVHTLWLQRRTRPREDGSTPEFFRRRCAKPSSLFDVGCRSTGTRTNRGAFVKALYSASFSRARWARAVSAGRGETAAHSSRQVGRASCARPGSRPTCLSCCHGGGNRWGVRKGPVGMLGPSCNRMVGTYGHIQYSPIQNEGAPESYGSPVTAAREGLRSVTLQLTERQRALLDELCEHYIEGEQDALKATLEDDSLGGFEDLLTLSAGYEEAVQDLKDIKEQLK